MGLSSEQMSLVIEKKVEEVMKETILPHVLREMERQLVDKLVEAVKYVYTDEIRKAGNKIVAELSKRVKITVEVVE